MKRTVPNIVCACLLFCFCTFFANGQTVRKKINVKKEHRYINFPVNDSSALVKTRILVDGKVVDEFTISLANKTPDYWTFFDVSGFQGKNITIEFENTDAG